jgi:hypothetical protein
LIKKYKYKPHSLPEVFHSRNTKYISYNYIFIILSSFFHYFYYNLVSYLLCIYNCGCLARESIMLSDVYEAVLTRISLQAEEKRISWISFLCSTKIMLSHILDVVIGHQVFSFIN